MAFDIPEEIGSWVDVRVANAINAATTPENIANFATAVSGAMQSFLTGETDRAIAAAETSAENVIAKLIGVLGQPVATVLSDLTGAVDQTGQGLTSDISGVGLDLTGALGNLASQIISGVLADLPHLLTKQHQPDADPT